ncbi:MAG: hypothetical protein RL258_918 [Pseudomonadota bacterium]|jgi:predicted nucleotidyltransferase
MVLPDTRLPTDPIEEVTSRLVSAFSPQAIYVFGSRAWGQPCKGSDLDLLVVIKESTDAPWARASKGFEHLRGSGVGCDLLVRTETEIREESRFTSSLVSKILRDGKKIYAAP